MPLSLFCTDPHAIAADKWITANPMAFDMFCRIALDYHFAHKGKKVGAKAIIEIMRYELMKLGEDQGEFKYNNNYTKATAIRAIEKYPELAGTLTTRAKR